MEIIDFACKALGCPHWTESAGVKKHLAPKRALQHVQGTKATTAQLGSSAQCQSWPLVLPVPPLSLPRREDILALGLSLCILPRGDEKPLGLLCPPTSCAPKRHRPHRRWPGNKTRLLVPPAFHVTRTLQTSRQNVTLLSQSLLIEQQMLVAQTVPVIFDG